MKLLPFGIGIIFENTRVKPQLLLMFTINFVAISYSRVMVQCIAIVTCSEEVVEEEPHAKLIKCNKYLANCTGPGQKFWNRELQIFKFFLLCYYLTL